MDQDFTPVHLARVADYQQEPVDMAIEALFSALPITQTLNASRHVVLKPNLLAKRPPEAAVTTHPAVVRGVIRACKARGVPAEQITIADSPGGLYHPRQMSALYQVCGLSQVAQEEGVHLYTQCQSQQVPCQGQVTSSFQLVPPIYQADVLINLPKFKSHMMTGMTAGCKNMFGAVPGLEKSQWHTRFPKRQDFGHMLVDLLCLLPPSFTLLDGILAMEGEGPGGGDPRELGLLLASENTWNLDLAVAHLMGLDPLVVPYLQAAHQRGLCPDHFPLAQDPLWAPIPQWKLPSTYENNQVGQVQFSQFLPSLLRPVGEKLEESLAPRPVITSDLCIGCGKCLEICDKKAISLANHKATIRAKDCIRCFCCHEVCPVKAIQVKQARIFRF